MTVGDAGVIIQLLIGGLLLGGVYTLMALGLSLIYGVSGILNLTHGDFLMLGAVAGFFLVEFLGINPFLAIVVIFPVFFCAGIGFFRVVVRSLTLKSAETLLTSSIITTVGLGFMIEDSVNFFAGHELNIDYFKVYYVIPPPQLGDYVLPVSSTRLIVLAIIVVSTLALHFWTLKTTTGKLIRAITQDREAVVMMGVSTDRIVAVACGIAIFFASMAGVFLMLLSSVTAFDGLPFTIKALTVIILGGVGSLPGTVVGAVIIGLLEAFGGFYLGSQWASPLYVLVLLATLVLRPQGLLGRKA